MQTGNDKNDDCCPITTNMWQAALSCRNEINKSFNDCISDNDGGLFCIIATGTSCGIFPITYCAAWLLCSSSPPAAAIALTPAACLMDCSIFSVKKIESCLKNNDGPRREMMIDQNRRALYGDL